MNVAFSAMQPALTRPRFAGQALDNQGLEHEITPQPVDVAVVIRERLDKITAQITTLTERAKTLPAEDQALANKSIEALNQQERMLREALDKYNQHRLQQEAAAIVAGYPGRLPSLNLDA